MSKYDLDKVTLGELLADPKVVAIVDEYAPGITKNPAAAMVKGMKASSAIHMASGFVPAETVQSVCSRIENL
ncbi:hypothetical protein [Nigerium massiliense]|uniref:hypothetical protein n=1 Tax=Nigerium massiliense TaxID=1522317 RepID=UPI0005913A34|nr:hypothetical protein [Nigerium massiliense]